MSGLDRMTDSIQTSYQSAKCQEGKVTNGSQSPDPATGTSLQHTEITRLQAKHHAAGYFELYGR
jgi:hypothetical protein